MAEKVKPQPSGVIKLYDKRGYGKLPSSLLKDLNVGSTEKNIPYVSHYNCVLLISPTASTDEIISGLDILKDILRHRTTGANQN